MSRGKSLAKALVSQLDESGMRDFIMEPGDALQLLSKRTLLVVVDTHRPDFVEYPPLLEKVKTVIVIDHHRKTVNFIDNAVIFYHEPTASSASEMVTELLPYMSNKPLSINCRRRRCLRASCSTRVILCCAPECIPLRQRHTCAGAVRIPCA